MKNRGFTLVEMLAIITLLGLLALLITPSIINQKNKKEKEITEAQKQILFSDVGKYLNDNSKYNIKSDNVFCIRVNTLIEEDYISMDASKFKNDTVKVTIDENGNFIYGIDNKCKEVIKNENISIVATPNNWSKNKMISINGNTSIGTLQYQIGTNTGTWLNYTEKVKIEENTTVYARLVNGENIISTATLKIDKIDNNPPTCVSSGGTDIWIANSQTINGTCSDSESGCKEASILKVFSTTATYDDNYSPGVVYDNAGNSATCPNVKVRVTGTNVNNYVQSGSLFILDGKTGLSSTQWTDQSGNGNNGTVVNATVSSDSLVLDGTINQYVKLEALNYQEVTMESVFKSNLVDSEQRSIVSNTENGGYAIIQDTINNVGNFAFYAYKNSQYYKQPTLANIGKIGYFSGRVNSQIIKQKYNESDSSFAAAGTIGYPQNNTILVIGGNPSGTSVNGPGIQGNVYAVRMYNRFLTDDEIQKNYVIDKARFGF